MPTPEAGLALKRLVAWAGLRCGSLSSARGHRGQLSQMDGAARAQVQKNNEPSEQEPL